MITSVRVATTFSRSSNVNGAGVGVTGTVLGTGFGVTVGGTVGVVAGTTVVVFGVV